MNGASMPVRFGARLFAAALLWAAPTAAMAQGCTLTLTSISASPDPVTVGASVAVSVGISYRQCRNQALGVGDDAPAGLTYAGCAATGSWSCAGVTSTGGAHTSAHTPDNNGNRTATLRFTYTAAAAGSRTVTFRQTLSGATRTVTFTVVGGGPPTVATSPASAVTATTATLTGVVTSNGSATSAGFEFGPTPALGAAVAAMPSPLDPAASGTTVSATVGGLGCGRTYHFRATATNAGGTAYGAAHTFDTPACQPIFELRMDEAPWTGSPGEVTDSAGGHHGSAAGLGTARPTTAGIAPAVPGSPGSCRYGVFDRANKEHVLLPPGFPDLGSQPFTMTAWIRSRNASLSGQRIFVDDEHNSRGFGFSLGDGGAGRLRFYSRGTPSALILDTPAVIASGTWYFVAAVADVSNRRKRVHVYSAAGTLLASVGATWTEAGFGTDGGRASIGGETNASGERSSSFGFAGNLDEVRVYADALDADQLLRVQAETRPCPATGPDHYEVSLAAGSLACLPTTVTVVACADASRPCTRPATTVAGQTVTLAASAGALADTLLTFDAAGVATTTLSYPAAADGSRVDLALGGESAAATQPRQCCHGGSCSAADACSTVFRTAGFIVSAAAGGGATTIPAQTAGAASASYVLRAVTTGGTTRGCEAALTGPASVDWSYTCHDPSTCASGRRMAITGSSTVAIAGNPGAGGTASTAVPMRFDADGNAPFSFRHADVGRVSLTARLAAGNGLLSSLSGSSNAFVVRPAGFTVSDLRCTAYAAGACATAAIASPGANPGASSAAGAAFAPAGASFSATLTAVDAAGNATPSFGRETSPEGLALTATLVLPAGGTAGTLAGGSVAGARFSSGVATPTDLSYSEVGIITLTPSVADGDYLGVGNVVGAASGPIGRFVPARFTLAGGSVGHRAGLGCAPASGFTHLGENFQLGFTLAAVATGGAVTRNYAGAFARLDPTSAAAWRLAGVDGGTAFSSASGRLALGSASGGFVAGVAAVTLTAQALRGAVPDGPFDAGFGIAPVDADGVALTGFDLDTDATTAGNDRVRVADVALRFGRLRLLSARGAADRPLDLPVRSEYWDGGRFVTNTLDDCTQVPAAAVSLGNLRRTLTSADTTVLGPVAISAGRGALRLAAPGGGRSGSVDIALSLGAAAVDVSCLQPWAAAAGDAATAGAALPYLRGAWCGATWDRDPAARASFGLPRGHDAWIYRRENY